MARRAAGVKFALKDVDKGWRDLLKTVKDLRDGGSYVKVGVQGDDAKVSAGEMSVVKLAAIHEFGSRAANIPQRSFIRSTYKRNQRLYLQMLRALLAQVLKKGSGMTIERALSLVGAKMSSDIKRYVTEGEGVQPPNTPQVFLRKLMKNTRGFNRTGMAPRPLVDTGQMINSVTWAVFLKGRPKRGGK